jgi:hypothetical protein
MTPLPRESSESGSLVKARRGASNGIAVTILVTLIRVIREQHSFFIPDALAFSRRGHRAPTKEEAGGHKVLAGISSEETRSRTRVRILNRSIPLCEPSPVAALGSYVGAVSTGSRP